MSRADGELGKGRRRARAGGRWAAQPTLPRAGGRAPKSPRAIPDVTNSRVASRQADPGQGHHGRGPAIAAHGDDANYANWPLSEPRVAYVWVLRGMPRLCPGPAAFDISSV